MHLCRKGWIAGILLAAPVIGSAVSCTTQAELQPQDRSALASIGQRLTGAILQQDMQLSRRSFFHRFLHNGMGCAARSNWERPW